MRLLHTIIICRASPCTRILDSYHRCHSPSAVDGAPQPMTAVLLWCLGSSCLGLGLFALRFTLFSHTIIGDACKHEIGSVGMKWTHSIAGAHLAT